MTGADFVESIGLRRDGSPAGVSHLLVADDLIAEGHLHGTYLAMCGALVAAPSLPPSSCPEGCECDSPLYCQDCARRVGEWSAQ